MNYRCLIDTPGINASTYPEHREISQYALIHMHIDKYLYVIESTAVGTTDQYRQLEWLSKNVDGNKLIVVLNKVDRLISEQDDLLEQIQNVRSDLYKFGFAELGVYPVCAKLAYLLKKKIYGLPMSRFEENALRSLTSLFEDDYYKLNRFYPNGLNQDYLPDDFELLNRSGIICLERLLYL